MQLPTNKLYAQKEIMDAVNDISAIYPEGEPFFDELDNFLINVASPKIYSALFELTGNKPLILTGGFGKRIAAGIDSGEFPNNPYILFKGGLRKGNEPEVIKFSIDTLEDRAKYVMIDDTIYAGTTYRKIKDFLKEHDITVNSCIAMYDGCPIKKDDVQSLFRYYDFFKDVKPNFQFTS